MNRLSSEQSRAVAAIRDWYEDPYGPQTFRLTGPAGSGKTSIAGAAVRATGVQPGEYTYAAFTGKAVQVLRSKHYAPVKTLHSLLYVPVAVARQYLETLRAERARATDRRTIARLDEQIRREVRRLEVPGWIKRDEIEPHLVIVDESSMVGAELGRDLADFPVRILALGDHAQLPPVAARPYFTGSDFELTEVHRQAEGSPVLAAATAIRTSTSRTFDADLVRASAADVSHFDQVLVGTNRTRWDIIDRMRAGAVPVPGERIVVLFNNTTLNVINGEQFTVIAAHGPDREDVLDVECVDEEGEARSLRVWACGFRDLAGEKEAKAANSRDVAAATYAHAITVHKSQGSQWDRVLVVDEAMRLGQIEYHSAVSNGRTDAGRRAYEHARRWLYTAVTRAMREVAIVKPGEVMIP